MPDETDELFDWESLKEDIAEDEKNDKTPIGSDIQRALRDECLKVSPYVRMETGTKTRFDLAMYLPKGMPFITEDPDKAHCLHKLRRIYCQRKWTNALRTYAITIEESQKRAKELAIKDGEKDDAMVYRYTWNVPQYRYKDKEYKDKESFWKSNAKKELAICDQANCEWYKQWMIEEERMIEQYGFMSGLHLFEVKSDKDNHNLLIHQIPNMVAIADYVWLVLGENQPKPEWLPPYVSILRYKKGKFKIEYKHQIVITQPPMYHHSFADQRYHIKNTEGYAFTELMRDWRINSMFRFMFEGQVIIDMQPNIEKLLSFLRRAEKNKTKDDQEKFQRKLFEYGSSDGNSD